MRRVEEHTDKKFNALGSCELSERLYGEENWWVVVEKAPAAAAPAAAAGQQRRPEAKLGGAQSATHSFGTQI